MTREDYEELTKDELKGVAEEKGITLLALDSKGTMIDKIMGEKPAKEVKRQKEPPLGALYSLDGKKVDAATYEVEIFATDNDKSPVDIIVNGHNIRVNRGQKVRMLAPYVEVLRNAVVDTIIQDQDTGERSSSKQLMYPFSAMPV